MNEYRIVVDAGHGGSDPGAVSGNLKEKDLNLKAANYMYERFKEMGIPVAITRDDDTSLTRAERLRIMTNTFGNDSKVLVLSNHINAGGGEGAEVVYPLRTDATLPSMILDAIGDKGQIKRKYYQRVLPEDPSKDYYYIMRETPNTTALLIEYGFIDNPKDQQKLQNNLLDYVEGVVEAVANYIGVPYKKPGEITGEPTNTYTVKKGDSLYKIANQFNTTVSELKSLNNLTTDFLQVGQILKLPVYEEQPSTNENEYIVQSGDTLYKIANQFNVSVNDLIEQNELPTTILTPGQVLKIPTLTPSTVIYTVKPGDTLYKIANNYGVTVDAIKTLNKLTSNTLSIGQDLYIPEGTTITETDYIVYKVEPGDTLYKIATKYKTTPEAIKEYNNLSSNLLTINQILQIPTEKSTSESNVYVVRKGDNLYKIANNYGVTVKEIMNLNNLDSTLLSIGDTLLIPKQITDF